MTRHLIREAQPTGVATATERGTLPIVIASPGWGSSGWYGAQVLENAAESRVFPKGLHLYLDHPGESERMDRPERSVRDLVAVLAEDASWDGSQLVGEAKVFGPYREMFRDEDFVAAIGVSLRAYADTTVGEAEGRKGTIITELVEAQSVDFVTHAGRGGKVLSVLESAGLRPERMYEACMNTLREARNVGHWVESRLHLELTRIADDMFGDGRLTREERIALSGAVSDALTAFSGALETSQPQLYQRDLWDEPAAIADAVEASHNPPAPAGQSTATESEETHMAHTQIEEAELGRLRQDAERVPTLESERDQATARATEAERTAQAATRRADAVEMIAESGHAFTRLERRGLLADLPATEDGALDREAFTATLTESAADSAVRQGAGTVNGFGRTVDESGDLSDTDLDAELAALRGRTPVKEG